VETKDQDEKTETDKNRERRKKKATKRKREEARAKAKARVDKINPGMGNKRAKMRTLEEVREAVVNDSKIIQTKQVKPGDINMLRVACTLRFIYVKDDLNSMKFPCC